MPQEQPAVHIAIVGNTGVGKSTLVNVLSGQEVAKVNNDAGPCTLGSIKYEVTEGGTKYCIWDTRGLNEALAEGLFSRVLRLFGKVSGAERELKNCLLGSDSKVNLVLLCLDAKKIRTKVLWKIYNKVYVDLGERRLQVAVVITQLQKEEFESSGWKRTCKDNAKGVVKEFPVEALLVAVPKFEGLGDPIVRECKSRILGLISNACGK